MSKKDDSSVTSDKIDSVREAMKKAGRGGWRVNLEAVYEAIEKAREEQREAFVSSVDSIVNKNGQKE